MKIAFLGCGKMGEAILAGLLKKGHNPADFLVPVRREARGVELAERYGITICEASDAVREANVVIFGVKPQDALATLAQVERSWQSGTVFISILVGISTAQLESWLPLELPVIRVMPNTPAAVGAGVSGISVGKNVSEEQLQLAVDLMSAVGTSVVIPEAKQDALAAISGSGPAYFFYFVEALVDAGVERGLPRDIATQLAVETCVGAGKLLSQSGLSAKELRDQVTSPGGTTIAALRQFEEYGIRAGIAAGVEAAVARSEQLRADQ